jgi:hypothetical protein
LARLEELKFEYVPKEENPPNVPQLRPMAKIRTELKSIETTGVHKEFKEIPTKALKAHKLGVIGFFFARNS